MATYRLEAKVISRAKGRSATASAAYRSAGTIEDERTGQLFDYTAKRGVLHSEIMAPANTPEWMLDRSALWNAVERVEQRRDAQLARDFILSLPHEMTHEQRVELVRDFLGEQFVARGMIADFSVHAPDRRSDERNHHAHVMVTMRELTGAGFGLKNREWNKTALLEEWRERWADTVNKHLERHGHEARVDHRSLEDQGIDREPEPKQGPVATEMERNGKASHAGEDRRQVKARNDEREALLSAANDVDAELIMLDPDRPRGPAFEDVREALEGNAGKRRSRFSHNDSDGGMVAQQAAAMRRFRLHFAQIEGRRAQQSQDGSAAPLSLDASGEISKFGAGNDERPDMVSKYDQLRAEQSKALPEQAAGPSPDPDQGLPSAVPDLGISDPTKSQSSGLKWSMDQSMPAQNAAANAWTKASHEHRQEQGVSRAEPDRQDNQGLPAEPEMDESQPEPQLRFSEDRGGERSGRIDLKREQSEAEPSRDDDGDRKLNFARDRNQTPDLGR